MSDIVLTAGVRQNLLQLQKTADLITATQTKLATGKRVNTALDNPINFFTAQGLSNRASDLGNLLDSMANGINTIQAANNGITSITKLVQSAQALHQPGAADRRHHRPRRASRFSSTPSAPRSTTLVGRRRLQRHQPARRQQPDGHPQRNRHLVGHGDGRRLHFRRPCHRRIDQLLGRRRRHHRSLATLTAALTTLRSQAQAFSHQPVDRADPPGLHQGDDQHAADRRGQPHAGRFQRGRRQPARPADPPAAVDHRPVARLAGRQSVLRLFQ